MKIKGNFKSNLSNQVVFLVGHIYSVPFNSNALRGVKGRFGQAAILSPTFRPCDTRENTVIKVTHALLYVT